MPGGGWRGFGPLLAGSLDTTGWRRYANLASAGARVRSVRDRQLPAALRQRPDAVAMTVGMNDTLRSDFDPVTLHDDLDAVIGTLRATGVTVLTTRYHDHGRVFRLPRPLRRALHTRVTELNAVTDAVVTRYGALCLDLDSLPGAYDVASWSVDRLHPSERGHRMLARGFGALLADAGAAIPHPVSPDCGGGRRVTAAHHVGWLVLRGTPWMLSRGRDLLPHAASIVLRDLCGGAGGPPPSPPAAGTVVRCDG
ncbi:MAG: SGNH/GDSL hydrolase family protein [Pseudonocardiaceae bacterium]|nr:SGNH/GDSL hydrolase family protein [Pseudonocardiaceae bacterium]